MKEFILENLSFLSNPFISTAILIFTGIAAYTDIKEKKIHNTLNYTFLMLRLAAAGVTAVSDYGYPLSWSCIAGALLGFFIILIPAMIMNTPMGGDIKFAGVLGLWINDFGILCALALGCIGFVLFNKLTHKSKTDMIPLGPFMTAGYLITAIVYFILNGGAPL